MVMIAGVDVSGAVFRQRLDKFLDRGLCIGKGRRDGQMCVEAAVCAALGLPHSDNPPCVARAERAYKITINDSNRWQSPASRAAGLRRLAIAQVGSKGVVDDRQFAKLLAERHIRKLIPKLFREVLARDQKCLDAALRCELDGSQAAAHAAHAAANAANAAYAAARAADAAAYAAHAAAYAAARAAHAADAAAHAAHAADAAAYAADANAEPYLILSADLALEVLIELKSPGCEWLD